jgi:O-antigen/teichoic acid export membrane protein
MADIISLMLAAIIGLWILIRSASIKNGLNWTYIVHALKFGGGLVPHIYGSVLIATTDRLLITNMVGVAATGLYTVGAQIAGIVGVLEQSFNQAWSPWLFERLERNQPDELETIRRIIRTYNVIIIVLAVALSWVAPWFLSFFVGEEFIEARQFVFWLALGSAFSGMYKMVVNQIFFMNKTHLLALITFASGASSVILNYVLISWNGAVGAAQANALALLLTYILAARLSSRVMAGRRESASG